MWKPKQKLAEKAHEIAEKKYPDGYNKKQLIECSKEVYGGFGATQAGQLPIYKTIKTMEDCCNLRNAMANIDGRYPLGMTGCEVVGINGDCGIACPVYLEGECESIEEMVNDLTGDDLKRHQELYG